MELAFEAFCDGLSHASQYQHLNRTDFRRVAKEFFDKFVDTASIGVWRGVATVRQEIEHMDYMLK